MNEYRLAIAFTIFLALGSSACSEIEYQALRHDSKFETLGELTPEQFNVNIVSLEAPNEYRANLHLANLPSQAQLVRFKNENELVYKYLKLSLRELNEIKVLAGLSYRFEVGYGADSDFTALAYRKATIPIDVVVSKSADQFLKAGSIQIFANRLFFENGSRLKTLGRDLKIEVTEIISNGAEIVSFDDRDQAKEGMPGRAGGLISIKAQRLTGALTISVRGERGGKGRKGTRGPVGRIDSIVYGDGSAFQGSVYQAARACRERTPGGRGDAGAPGRDGGSSGSAAINIDDFTREQLKIFLAPGAGGEGGEGGDGGASPPPRPGGRDGHLPCPGSVFCCPQSILARGGDPGPQGPPGAPGTKEQIRLNNEEVL